MIRDSLKNPYWVTDIDKDLPACDVCREIIEPNTNEKFPLGAVGLRVDDDWWAVAVLPYEYKSWELKDILKDLWPLEYRFTCHPDSGSQEQTFNRLEISYNYKNKECDYLYKRVAKLEKQLRHSTLNEKEIL